MNGGGIERSAIGEGDTASESERPCHAVGGGPPAGGESRRQMPIGVKLGEVVEEESDGFTGLDVCGEGRIE